VLIYDPHHRLGSASLGHGQRTCAIDCSVITKFGNGN
jgi:hypothetical protein